MILGWAGGTSAHGLCHAPPLATAGSLLRPPLPPQRLSLATVPAAWLLNSSGCAGALLRLAAVCGGMVRCPDPRPAPLAALLPPLLPRPQVLAHALLRARSLSSRWRYLHEQFKGQG